MRGAHEHNGPKALVDAIFTRPTPKRGAMHLRRKKELIADRSTCENCAITLPAASMLHMHHTVPVSRGGSDGFDNLILLWPTCHAIAHWLDEDTEGVIRHGLVGLRPFTPVLIVVAGLTLSLCGVFLDDKRRLLRPALIAGGYGVVLCGLWLAWRW